MLMKPQLLLAQPQADQPLHALVPPEFEPLPVAPRLHEELHLHLLELARPEREVAGRDLVAERLADLRDAERDLLAGGLEHVQRSEEHTSELQSRPHLLCRLLLEKKTYCPLGHRSSPSQ